MTLDLALFILRLLSGAVLVAVLGLLFLVMWRDYRSAVEQAEAKRRSYGRLAEVHQLDSSYVAIQSHPLLPLTSIGRSPTNTIVIDDDFASGEHALVALRNGQWWLEDRQSRNGTTINGVPIALPVIVSDGDIIGVGNMQFRLELES